MSPDPKRPGTVYRSRPRLFRRNRSAGLQQGAPGTPSGAGPEPGGTPQTVAYPAGPGGVPPFPGQGAAPGGYPPAPYPGAAQPGGPHPGGPYPGGPHPAGPYPGGPGGPGGPGAPYGSGPGGRAPRRRRRRLWPWVLTLVVVLLIAYPVLLGLTAWTNLHRVDAFPASGRPADTPGRTFLVVGSDSRSDLTRAERSRLGTGQAAGQRTDTIMLLHVPAGDGPTVLVSIPRDSYVAIPGHSKNKINAAFAFGGPQLLVRTVEQATGVHVDEYVETGLGGYADLVDAVGGVRVCVKRAIKDTKAHIDLAAGCQVLDGKNALGYARARYSDPRGDLGRVERQRQVLAAIASRTLSPAVLAVPWRAFPAGKAGGNALTVDSGTSPVGLADFILAMRAVAGGNGLSLTVPIAGDITTSAGDSLLWNATKSKVLFDALRRDDTAAIRPLATDQAKQTG